MLEKRKHGDRRLMGPEGRISNVFPVLYRKACAGWVDIVTSGLLVGTAALFWGCTVISSQTMAEADPALPFALLSAQPENFKDRMVIVGGYVLEVRNRGPKTILVILQAPLGGGQEPVDADRSEGRFMVHHDRFLDPEVFTKWRKVTLAGIVRGVTSETIGDEPYAYLTLESREIFLWEERNDLPAAGPRYYRPYSQFDSIYDRPYRHPYY